MDHINNTLPEIIPSDVDFNESETDILAEETYRQLEFRNVLQFISRKCYSDLGVEIVNASLPQRDIYWLRNEHKFIQEMTKLLTSDDPIPFDGVKDVRSKLYKARIDNSILSPIEILNVSDFIKASRVIKKYFKSREDKYPIISEETNFLFENRMLEKHISDCIDDTGEVRDSASSDLQRIRRELQYKSIRLRNRIEKIVKNVSGAEMLQEDYFTLREGRFVIPVKAEHKRQIPGIIHGVSQSGLTVFLEPSEIFEMNNEISLLSNEEKREIHKILTNLTSEIGDEADIILATALIIAHLDAVYGKARYAIEFGGAMPDISDDNELIMEKIRHPLLVHAKGSKNVVPLSIEFTNDKRGHLISGPNAGGKTVALKSIGLNLLLVLSGFFPLGYCRTNFRRIYASIGDHQSIENNFSTFSAQMFQLNQILGSSDNSSLALIDEICSGTDPQEGSALACGILDSLIEMHSFFVATTHQSSLKSYALSRNVIDNASLEFDSSALKPTYTFLSGIPGNSYAFVLAKSIGLPLHIIKRAEGYLGDKHSEIEQSITALQRYKSDAQQMLIQAERDKIKVEQLRKQFEEKLTDFNSKKAKIMNDARNEAADIVAKGNSLIENTIRELKEKNKEIKDIKKSFDIERKDILNKANEIRIKNKEINNQSFEIGDNVSMDGSNSIGSIIIMNDETNTAIVEFNGLKFSVNIDQLNKVKKSEAKKQSSVAEHIRFDAESKIDVRGLRASEAISQIDDFINNANVGNLNSLRIIHGKGTGALRKAIHEFLKSQFYIKSFRLGELVEGGDGITIVEL